MLIITNDYIYAAFPHMAAVEHISRGEAHQWEHRTPNASHQRESDARADSCEQIIVHRHQLGRAHLDVVLRSLAYLFPQNEMSFCTVFQVGEAYLET